jgi:hypothetical protein
MVTAQQLRLKVATGLMWLHGRTDVYYKIADRAGAVMDISRSRKYVATSEKQITHTMPDPSNFHVPATLTNLYLCTLILR